MNNKKEYDKKYREEHKEEKKIKSKEYYQNNTEKVLKRNKKYRENHKGELKIKAKEYRKNNKEELKEYNKKWRKEHEEELKIKTKEYRKNNKEKKRETDKKWRENHKEETKEYRQSRKEETKKYNKKYKENNKENNKEYQKKYQKKYQKERKKTDPIFRLRHNISSALCSSLKERGMSKQGKSTFDLIGYSKEQFIKHLESLFVEGMSLENYGEWVIDHVIPDSFFDYNDIVEFRMCWRLENLQPMWKEDNIEKSDKITLWGKEINARFIEEQYFSKLNKKAS